MNNIELKEFLDQMVVRYQCQKFVPTDPISIPHQFDQKEDIEIAGFLSATLAWGQRITIIRNGNRLMDLLEREPHQFMLHASEHDFNRFSTFVHRTFNGVDCEYFVRTLSQIYRSGFGMEGLFTQGYLNTGSSLGAIEHFRNHFLSFEPQNRVHKHIASPAKGASAKRLNMFLRWMVRSGECGVDFGLWKNIPTSALMIPLDIHSGNVARKLGLLTRPQNDWRAVDELTTRLRIFDPVDPVKYDFALFGLGAFESF